ncbi:MAG: MFS transporter [Abditibacteriota bacterium]|nr:MFS transporter [Abditibacteriota bacterium]
MSLKNTLFNRLDLSLPPEVKRTFIIELVAGVFIAIGSGCFSPYCGLIARQDFNAGEFLIGVLSAGTAAGALACILSSGLVPRGREKEAYAVSCAAGRFLVVFMAFCTGAPVFCWLGFFAAMLSVLPGPQYNILMQRLYPIEFRGRLMGLARVNVAIFQLASIFISGRFMHGPESWRTVFIVSGICFTAGSLLYLLWRVPPPEKEEEKTDVWKNIKGSMSLMGEDRIHLYLILILTVTVVAVNIQIVIMPIFQADVLKMDPPSLSVVATLGSLAMMPGYIYWGRFVDKRGSAAAYSLQNLVLLSLPLSYFAAKNYLWIIPGTVAAGFANAGVEIAWRTLLMELSKPGQERRVQTLHGFFDGVRCLLGIGMGVFLIAFINCIGAGLKYVFAASAVIQLCGIIPLMLLLGRRKKGKKGIMDENNTRASGSGGA